MTINETKGIDAHPDKQFIVKYPPGESIDEKGTFLNNALVAEGIIHLIRQGEDFTVPNGFEIIIITRERVIQ